MPDKCSIYIAAIEDGQYKSEKKNFWNDVYGVNMSCLTPTVMREPLIDCVDSNMLMSTSSKVLQLDLCTMKPGDVEFSSKYSLTCSFDDKVHALVGWWDCEFSNIEKTVSLSTSPSRKNTHWKQTVFYLEHDLEVRKGDVIHGSIANRKSKTNFRELDIKISYHINSNNLKRDFTSMYKLR